MRLTDLIGLREFSGFDSYTVKMPDENKFSFRTHIDAKCVDFIMDGKTYTVMENPYWSDEIYPIIISDKNVINKFPPIKVFGVARGGDEIYFDDPLIDFYDISNSKLVFCVGIKSRCDDTPAFDANFYRRNVAELK